MCSEHTTLGRARERAGERKGAEPVGRERLVLTRTQKHTHTHTHTQKQRPQDNMWQQHQLVGVSFVDLGLMLD